MRKQSAQVAADPAVERSVAEAFEGEQQAKRHDLAGMKFCLRMLLGIRQDIVNVDKQFDGKKSFVLKSTAVIGSLLECSGRSQYVLKPMAAP